MKVRNFTILGFMLFVIMMMPVARAIAADLLPPQLPIHTASEKLQEKLQDKSFTKDFTKITQFVHEVIDPYTDFDRISALVLGKLWKTATTEEKERFKHEFQTLLVRSYSRAFVEFKEWSVRFLPLNMENDTNKVIVKTEVIQPGIQPIGVDYRMFLTEGQWKAYDIMIGGVSLVTTYRTTFTNEVQAKGSLSAVIDSLAKRNAEALSAKNS